MSEFIKSKDFSETLMDALCGPTEDLAPLASNLVDYYVNNIGIDMIADSDAVSIPVIKNEVENLVDATADFIDNMLVEFRKSLVETIRSNVSTHLKSIQLNEDGTINRLEVKVLG
jgi:hypothetical protein